MRSFTLAITFVVAVLPACAETVEEPPLDETDSALSVGSSVGGTCSTAVVRGLSRQIAREVDCMSPSSLARLRPSTKVKFTSNAVLPYMHPRAKADLLDVSGELRINSGYRTVAQQYLLYRWFRAGRCGIAAAATPGRSNHESGRAVDLQNWAARLTSMRNHGWSHSVPGDDVHFDHFGSPDNRGKDVLAFQRLWNRNRPNDRIAADGIWGPQTAARMRRAPTKGFRRGPTCNTFNVLDELDTDVVLSIDGHDRVAPGEVVHYAITVGNPTLTAWPADTRLVVVDGAASELYDPASWASPTEVGPIGVEVPADGDAIVDVEVVAPMATEEYPAAVALALVDGAGATLGTIDLSVTVVPNGDVHTSGDADDDLDTDGGGLDEMADEDGVVGGGCAATGGSSGGLGLLVLALAAITRRRSARTSGRSPR
jgi:uncharacterized protein (TIGR03382 family)